MVFILRRKHIPLSFLFVIFFMSLTGEIFGSINEKGIATDTLTPVTKSSSESQTTFRILTEEFPPYNFTDNGNINGISTEIVRAIIKKIGHPDNLEVVPWSEGYDLIQKEDNLILFSTTRSPMREDLFKWVGPLVPNNTVFFAKKGSGISIKTLEDARNVKNIGVYKDDFGELLLKKKGFSNLDSVVDNKLNPKKLAEGKIDLWIMNELTGRHMAMQAGLADKIEKVFEVQKDYMYIAFSKSAPNSAIEVWQKALDEIRADGTFAQIFSKWIMFSYSEGHKSNKKLSFDENKWLEDHPIIKASFDPNWPPIEWVDEKGSYVGLTKDYSDLIQEKLGIKFDIVLSKDWAEVIGGAESREIDMIIAATQTRRRENFLLFTEPYLKLPAVIVVNSGTGGSVSVDDLKNKKVCVVSGFSTHEFLEQNYPEIDLDPVSDTLTGLLKVSFGKAYAMVANIAVTTYYAEKAFISNLRVAGESGYEFKLAFASRNDWPELHSILKKGLASISAAERQAIFQKWVAPKDESWKLRKEFIITIAIVIGGLFIGGIIYWNATLKKKVENRTAELSKSMENERHSRQAQDMINKLLQLNFEPLTLNELMDGALNEIFSIPWQSFYSKGSICLAEKRDKNHKKNLKPDAISPLTNKCAKLTKEDCICNRNASSHETTFACDDNQKSNGYYTAPITSGRRLLGVLNIRLKENCRRSLDEEKILGTVAQSLAGIIERSVTDKKLLQAKEAAEEGVLMKTGLSALSDIMHGKQDVAELADSVINFLTEYLKLPLAAFFVKDSEGSLARMADYGYLQKEKQENSFKFGSGIIGQAAVNKEPITITNIPEYAKFAFGFGRNSPELIFVYPLIYNEQTIGALELCGFNEFTENQMDWIKQAARSITLALQSVLIIADLKKTMYMEWNASYDVGVEKFNEQHKKLFAYTNALFNTISKGKNRTIMNKVLDSLTNYTVTHFKEEEDVLLEHNYPYYETQRDEHLKFVTKLKEIQTKFNIEHKNITFETFIFLVDWLKNHIAKLDRRYTEYLNQRGVS